MAAWQAHNQEEPFWWEQLLKAIWENRQATERAEQRLIWTLAQLTTVLVNLWKDKDSPTFTVDQFIPKWIEKPLLDEDEAFDMEVAAMNRRFDAWNAFVEGESS